MKKEIEAVRVNAAQAGVKLAIAIVEIENVDREGKWISEDKELSDMLHKAQALCHDICVHIDTRSEARNNVLQFIIESNDDLIAAGYEGPGWYFWDETWAYCHGPFDTRDKANDACKEYAKTI